MNTQPLCPTCLAANIIAPVAGPTCKHARDANGQWWPANWGTMVEAERVAWLETRKTKRGQI